MVNDEIALKIEAQRVFCHQNKVPHFAPMDGVCFYCNKQIYDKIGFDKAGNDLVTACPHCHHSFVE